MNENSKPKRVNEPAGQNHGENRLDELLGESPTRSAPGAAPLQPARRKRPSKTLSITRAILGATVSGLLLTGICLVGWIVWYVHQPFNPGPEHYLVKPGQSLAHIGQELERRNGLTETLPLRMWAKFTGDARKIKTGRYEFPNPSRLVDILDKLVRGDVVHQQVALIEGKSFREVLGTLANTSELTQTLGGMTYEEVLQQLGADYDHPEGLFFPDTYNYNEDSTDLEILKRAFDRMQEKLDAAWQLRQTDTPLKTAYEALILASIVEKETGAPHERPHIAGVFINRMRQNMKLQTDPTVIYGLGDDFDGNLTRKHLVTDTQYNTYTRRGLPPTPIALPGEAALLAVINPSITADIYFVSRGDGTHVFSETLEQHNAAVDRYQRKKTVKSQ